MMDSKSSRRLGSFLACLALAAVGLGVAIGCGAEDHGEDEHASHKEQGAGDEREEHGAVMIEPKLMVEMGIELASAGPGELFLVLSLSGEVRPNGDRVAHIVPSTPGIVRKALKTYGDTVGKGEVLAVIESAELGEAKVEYLASVQRLELAETDLARMERISQNTLSMLELLSSSPSLEELRKFDGEEMGENRSLLVGAYSEFIVASATWNREKGLSEKKITSESEYLAAEAALKKADAVYHATRDSVKFALRRDLLMAQRQQKLAEFEVKSTDRRLHVLGITDPEIVAMAKGETAHEEISHYALRSPFDGTIIDRHITLGEMLEPTETAYIVADLSRVWVDLTVYQKDLERVLPGQEVEIRSGTGTTVSGSISFVSPQLDEATRTAVARVIIENPKALWRPGMFVSASIEYARGTVAVLVPKEAIQTLDGEKIVFVEDEDGLEPRDVETGRESRTHIEVLSGLSPGDRYVAKGAFALKAELKKGSFGDGHGH